MINDLKESGQEIVERTTQVCIVGAGTAGIFLAHQLRVLGMRVLLLETGNRSSCLSSEMGQNCDQRGIRYRGAESGRSFGLGGTSVLWGGQMIALTPSDMAARPAVGFDAWPVQYSELLPYFAEVSDALGMQTVVSEVADDIVRRRFRALSQIDDDFTLRLSEWLPFKSRNFAQTFSASLSRDNELDVWLNATVQALEWVDDTGIRRVRQVVAQSANGRKLIVRADFVVVSAGALESTRLMLAFDEASGGGITGVGAPLGRYFSDHLSVTVGRFRCNNWSGYNHAVGPVFSRGVMRTPRLELSESAQSHHALTSAFAHFTFVTHGDSGFDVVRNWFRRRQGEQQKLGLSPSIAGKTIRDVAALGFWKTVHRRLWIPRNADLLLQVDIEQVPNWESRLSLTDDCDDMGRKRLAIDWRIRGEDIEVIRKVVEKVGRAWNSSSLKDLAQLELMPPENFADFTTLYDVYHPTGSLRMGADPASSVVDRNLRLWTVDNCYLSSTAVFPSAGSANPGYTHLALTARLARHLEQRLR